MEYRGMMSRRSALLPRPRLTAELGRVLSHKLALITAPGGYGKTTLIRDYMARGEGTAFCWVALDPADASLPIFWQQLARTLGAYLPPGGLLGVAPESHLLELAMVRHLGRTAAEVVGRHAEEHLVIVLDDLQHVVDSQPVMLFLEALLEYLPESVHVIISSRLRPPLPLARFRARGELIHLTVSDLSFTADEVRALFAGHLGLPLSEPIVQSLMEHTEGWITALLLLANLLEPMPQEEWGAFLRRSPGGEALFTFLAEEVFGQQPAHLQEFLLGSSILSTLQPLVVERILGMQGVGAIIQELEARGLFVLPLVGTEVAYRYHHLFQTFLQNYLLSRRGEEAVLRLHAKAAQVYAGLGSLPEAVEHYLQAGMYDRAAQLMAEQVEVALKSLRQELVRDWLDRLPAEVLEHDPNALAVRAQLMGWQSQSQALPALCQRSVIRYEEQGDYRGLARMLSWAVNRFWSLRHPNLRAACYRWAEHSDAEVRIYGRMLWALSFTTTGQWAHAVAELEQLLATIPPATRAHFDCLDALAALAFWRGDSRSVLKYGIPATVGRTALGDFDWAYHIWMSYCCLADPVGLELYHRQFLAQEVTPAMSRTHELVGIYGQGLIHLYHRRWEDALACFESLRPYFSGDAGGVRTIGVPGTFIIRQEMAWIYMRFNRHEEARRCLEQNLDFADNYPEVAALAHASMAYFFAETGEIAPASAHLAKARAADPPGVEGLTSIAVHAVAARVAVAEGDRGAACEALALAVSIARERECPWYLLYKGGPHILPLLVELSRMTLPGGAPGQAVFTFLGMLGDQVTPVLGPLLGHADPAVKAAAFTLLNQLRHTTAPQRVPHLKVYALGPLRVYRYDVPVDSVEWKRNKVKLLLVMLLLRRGKPVSKQLVMERLWPDAAPSTARNNLRATLHGLKRTLEPDLPPGASSRFIVNDRDTVSLGAVEEVWFDLWEFEDSVSRARAAQRAGKGEEGIQLLQTACDLGRGTFLPEAAFADHFADLRSRVEQFYLGASLEVARFRLACGEARIALDYARRALALDRAAEEAYQVIIEAHLALGERERAVQTYKVCRKQLRQVLGSEPSTRTKSLLQPGS